MKLSKNFTLKELTTTSTGIPNEPTPEARVKLFVLSQFILQPIRDEWGKTVVTSGYRNLLVNRKVGSKDTSQHLKGEAADIQPAEADIGVVFDWIVNHLIFGQAILEKKGEAEWIHISLPRQSRDNMQALEIINGVRQVYNV